MPIFQQHSINCCFILVKRLKALYGKSIFLELIILNYVNFTYLIKIFFLPSLLYRSNKVTLKYNLTYFIIIDI